MFTSLIDAINHWADERPGTIAFMVDGEAVTFAGLRGQAHAIKQRLHELGLQPLDRVSVFCTARLEMLEFMVGVAASGAIVVPHNVYLRGEPLVHQLNNSGSRFILVDAEGLGLLGEVADRLVHLEAVLVLGEATSSTAPWKHATWCRPIAPQTSDPLEEPEGSDLFAIMHTSGTTGLSKGVRVPHRYLMRTADVKTKFIGLREDDVVLTPLQMFHYGGLGPMAASLQAGVPFLLESKYSASDFISLIKRRKATVLMSVVWVPYTMLAQPEGPQDRDHDLRVLVSGQLTWAERAEFERRFGVPAQVEWYGQTECFPATMVEPGERGPEGTCGRAPDYLEIEIHDADGRRVPEGTAGEIVIRPREPGVMFDGYWGDPVRTLEAYQGLWYHTGDIGRLDGGYLTFVDRKKDYLRRRGENVSTYEVEQALLRHENVLEVAVYGLKVDGQHDEEIKACIVRDEALDLDSLAKHLATSLPYFAVPRFVEFRDQLPRNAAGRVTKDVLRSDGITSNDIDLDALGLLPSKADRRRAHISVGQVTDIGRSES